MWIHGRKGKDRRSGTRPHSLRFSPAAAVVPDSWIQVNFYSAAAAPGYELLVGYQLTSGGSIRNINGIKFTCDGCRIIAATNNKKLTVVDVERGEQIQSYENAAFAGREYGRSIPMACDPSSSHMAVCCCISGKGLTLFDMRMPLPLDFVLDLHTSFIRDVGFLQPAWPWIRSQHNELLSLSQDGVVKVTTIDGRNLHCFEVGHTSHCMAVTPEVFNSSSDRSGFSSLIMIGGDTMSRYMPDVSSVVQTEWGGKKSSSTSLQSGARSQYTTHSESTGNIWKMKYTSSGSMLYTATDSGVVKRYRRYPDGQHKFVGDVFSHKGDIFDMDISPLDEFLVTASRDKTVGVLCLGAPSHGFTGCTELT